MNRKYKILLIGIGMLLLAFTISFMKFYNRASINIDNFSTEINVNSQELVSLFIKDEKLANTIYTEKIIEVDGIVKEITFLNNRNTVLLYGGVWSSSVMCDMQTDQVEEVKSLRKGQKVRLKGVCKGFLKDAVLLNCKLINK